MRRIKLFVLCTALLLGWGNAGLAQSFGENVVSSALLMAPLQNESERTNGGGLTQNIEQNQTGTCQGNHFAFTPSFKECVKGTPSSDDKDIVTGGRPGGPVLLINQRD